MSLELAEVKKIAHLAAIAVEPEELEALGAKLSNILDLFAQLSQADTQGVEPMAHPLDQTQRLREDLVAEVDQRDKFQAIAPATENGLYLVPKVIE
ncbi:Asp-tRNA(Asn)/Glu-tRNA(Gln) amidotransferase subunit GatC [Thiomicrospira sp. R3]|uniref:Asp-tRNA(Asn)/Glu-tRNA(Gln) amidotransferase subunit GatC n=1 Tax=Thiomicrospira sp. R3 TaxID=3035472 RepID=UPI00259B6631|nr:Asp-tRNA(Asn)/Glu-tRNA(Gln) amidotransferase subunit GatC [Thiomicrospira sp. R3]WFE69070.1 Asp-tRNA(Asn)/Glu-tRNA(Gln) amidotransferase subunit GatC [Thiomicrospira sp. R3]